MVSIHLDWEPVNPHELNSCDAVPANVVVWALVSDVVLAFRAVLVSVVTFVSADEAAEVAAACSAFVSVFFVSEISVTADGVFVESRVGTFPKPPLSAAKAKSVLNAIVTATAGRSNMSVLCELIVWLCFCGCLFCLVIRSIMVN